jgi:hypothetical protein
MRVVVVRYKVKASKVDEHLGLVRAVFAELAQTRTSGIRYAAVRGPDGVSFTHIAQIEAGEDRNPLATVPSFKAFQRDLAARCDEPPSGTDVEIVGDHGLFG